MNNSDEFTVYAHKIIKGSTAKKEFPATNPIGWVSESVSDGDAFDQTCLGQWIHPKVKKAPQPVTAAQIPNFEGIVRSAFAMHLKGMQLEPVSSNPLCIFLSKAVTIQPKTYQLLC